MARVTRDKARWHVSFPGARTPVARERTGTIVGVDRGVSNTLATSDGRMLRAPVMRVRERRRLQRLQQRLARQRKGSQRRASTKRQIARLHQAVRDRRRNWIEIQTTRLVRENDLVAVESLNVKGMVRRPNPKPDPDAPGAFLANGAAAKSALNRSIHAQG
jgi:putative transposase